MDEHTLYAARDPWGVRPLALGRLERGWVVASETAALQTIGASVIREVEPGELIVIDEDGLRSHKFAEPQPKGCVFEYVYLARPDAVIRGRVVHEARVEMGRVLAREHAVEADLVIGVPESGVPAAVGDSQESGIPFGQGFVKNAYVGRTFIQPSQTLRQLGIRLKLNPLEHTIRGKKSSSSTTRSCAATPSGPRSGCSARRAPWRCTCGSAAARPVAVLLRHRLRDPGRVVATGLGVEEIRASIGADSLGYISEEGMIGATNQAPDQVLLRLLHRQLPIRCPRTAGSASTSSRPYR